ncbi:MAG: amidohydrolase family protein [Pyrinomonadaceae bacterium]|nr:amidohydrolase family protein [Pyrinomonadaceae bacterium]
MKIYCADFVLPVTAAPIELGAIAVDDAKIIAVGTKTEICEQFPNAETRNFDGCVITAGLVNCHAHLELTVMRGFLDTVENDFFAWLRKLTSARETLTTKDLEISATFGAMEAAKAGITCIGDIASFADNTFNALRNLGLRGVAFQETINPNAITANETFAKLKDKIAALHGLETETLTLGISPHAPYSVSPKLFELTTDFAINKHLHVSIHAAESKAERDFVESGAGIFADFLRVRNIIFDAPRTSTIKYLNALGVLQTKPLLAHCVGADESDIEILAETNSKVAHCPKSNAKFGHGIAPFADFIAKKIVVGLGSDSVASNNVCDVLEEARFAAMLARTRGDFVESKTVLRAATIEGAKALNLESKIGSLETGKQADFTVISLNSLQQQPVFDVYAALIFASSARDVTATFVAGNPIYENGEFTNVDEIEIRRKMSEIVRKIKV